MDAVTNWASSIARDLLTSLNHFQENDDEFWTVDWKRFALVCEHGVAVGLSSGSNKPTSDLSEEPSCQR